MTETALTKRLQLEGSLLNKYMVERYKDALPARLREKMDLKQAVVTIMRASDANPQILNADPKSIMFALLDAATLGLELSGPLHQAALVPYGNQLQMQIEYPGLIELMYRSGKVQSVKVGVVYSNDKWAFNRAGIEPPIHEAQDWGDRGDPLGVYAIVYLKDGGFTAEVMSKQQVEEHRDKFAMKNGKLSPAWKGSFWAMAQKTALRMVSKWVPKSKELAEAIQYDDAQTAGEQVHVALDLQPDPPPESQEPATRMEQVKKKLAGDDTIEAEFKELGESGKKSGTYNSVMAGERDPKTPADACTRIFRWADQVGVPYPEVQGIATELGIKFPSNNAPDTRTCTPERLEALQKRLEAFVDAMGAEQGSNGSEAPQTAPERASRERVQEVVDEGMRRKCLESEDDAVPVFNHLLRRTLVSLEDLTPQECDFLMERL